MGIMNKPNVQTIKWVRVLNHGIGSTHNLSSGSVARHQRARTAGGGGVYSN